MQRSERLGVELGQVLLRERADAEAAECLPDDGRDAGGKGVTASYSRKWTGF